MNFATVLNVKTVLQLGIVRARFAFTVRQKPHTGGLLNVEN